MSVEHRPDRVGIVRVIFGSGPVGMIAQFEVRPLRGAKMRWTEQVCIGDSAMLSESVPRAETVIITNV